MRDGLLAGVRHGAAPLAVWALHFFGSYAGIAVACDAGVDAGMLRGTLLGGTAVALAAVAVLAWRAWRLPARSLAGVAGRGASLLVAVALVWSAWPMMHLPTC